MATVAEQIQEIYIGLLGRAADKAGLDYWTDQVTNNGLTQDDVRANFVSSQAEYATGLGAMSRPAAVTELYARLFARAPEAAGLEYWVNGAGASVPADALVVALVTGAGTGDRAVLANKVEVAQYYTDNNPLAADYNAAEAAAAVSTVDGSAKSVEDAKAIIDGDGVTMSLTTAQDALTGTDKADTFNAYIFDNKNTAQSGDTVNGGGGTDRLYADIGDSQGFAVTLHTNSVEQLAVRAEASSNRDSTDNNLVSGVQIDAERMVGTDWYESNESRADVIIEDVRIERKAAYGDASDQITKDITVAMVSTDAGNVDLGVYFDQHSLVKQGDASSNSITMTVANPLETSLGYDSTKPLKDIPYTFVRFTVDGTDVQFSLDLTGVETYDQMFAALQTAFATEKTTNTLLADVNLTRSPLSDDFISRDGEARQADEYVLTSESGNIGVALVGWGADGGLPSNNAFSATVKPGDVSTTSNLITSTIVLDDVGSGSMGGDLVVGGMSIGTTSGSKGVEQFDITVERSSQLQEIQSTNNTLREVYIKNGAQKGGLVVAGSTNTTASADDVPGVEGNAGFTDVRVVDASAMTGSVSINAELTGAVVGKYLTSTDSASDYTSDNVDFLYKLGTSNDSLSLAISNANLAAAGTGSREDFTLNVMGGAGNDSINTKIGTGAGTATTAWYINQKDNANLTVDGGEGNDTIRTTGAGDFTIKGGSGNDTVYANNDGNGTVTTNSNEVQTITVGTAAGAAGTIVVDGVTVSLSGGAAAVDASEIAVALAGNAAFAAKASVAVAGAVVTITYKDTANQDAVSIVGAPGAFAAAIATTTQGGSSSTSGSATWVSNTTAGGINIDDLIGNGAGGSNLMNGIKLTVTYSGANTTGDSGVTSAVAAAATNGFESTVTINTSNKLGNNNTVNQAIKEAINGDAVLSKLLVATDGPADSLVIKSLVDGTYVLGDLAITMTAPTTAALTAMSSTELNSLQTALNDLNNTSGVASSVAGVKAGLDAAVIAQTSAAAAIDGTTGTLNELLLAQKGGADIVGAASTSDSDNAITLGAGDDVAVLGTDDSSNDTLVFAGAFGNDTIFNFTQNNASNAVDFLSFGSYLDGKTSVSGSAASQVAVANAGTVHAVGGTNALGEDDISVINDFAAAGTKTWANLTADALLNAIKTTGSVAHAGIVANTLNVDATHLANFVGTTQKNIVLIENDNNDGEYKVFELTASQTTDEFTAAVLVGTIDLGNTLTDMAAIG